ncbi:glycosyltransferase [Kineosporia sp. R_H_3]|uniref:glycosyltransferase n=1 Tax=Kineosporia sp. R_H_3 TaxID=1961848 RepID=UPI001E3772FF|nr:glycosyltransferase [Kineosporia sp. R_H_3]
MADGADDARDDTGPADGPVGGTTGGALAVVVPAKDEAERIAETVRAARLIPGASVVVVVDDGSTDDTAARAQEAGAVVVRHRKNQGKAAAMESGAARVARLDGERGGAPRALLFVDADLGGTAVNTAPLAAPVLAGEADLTIAILPAQSRAGGGRGFVVGLSREGIRRATGWTATQPLSGMRCLSREAFEAARPLARGWGVETAMTIDLLLGGYRVLEVPCDLQHRVTGSDWRGQVHRAKQYRDVARALAVRRLRRAAPLRVLSRVRPAR